MWIDALIITLSSLVSLAILLAIVYLLVLVRPRSRREVSSALLRDYAHRGLHGNGVPENSLKAFELACQRGYGIELDVQLSRDGTVMVFHDYTLIRMTGCDKKLCELDASELRELKLGGTDQTVPTFKEVLQLVGGRVPLLVELKGESTDASVCAPVAELLKEYKGEYIVESFNPFALAYFGTLMPNVARGFLCSNYLKHPKMRNIKYFIVQNMMLNFHSKPDFIAYDHGEWKNAGLSMVRFFYPKTPLICWTVRTPEEEAAAKEHGFTSFIFENYKSEL
jgi:glycerophosphoryl diester phosphodiesterase